MEKNNIVMVLSEDMILYGSDFEILSTDTIITKKDIKDLVDIEMSVDSHDNGYPEIETYENLFDFFSENAIKDNYLDFIEGHLDDKNFNEELLIAIQKEVVEEIKKQVEKIIEENEKIETIEKKIKKPSIIYKETKTLRGEVDFDSLVTDLENQTRKELIEQGIDQNDICTTSSKCRVCELSKFVTYSYSNNKIVNNSFIYKRNNDNTITIFEKIEE